eukprot:UN29176
MGDNTNYDTYTNINDAQTACTEDSQCVAVYSDNCNTSRDDEGYVVKCDEVEDSFSEGTCFYRKKDCFPETLPTIRDATLNCDDVLYDNDVCSGDDDIIADEGYDCSAVTITCTKDNGYETSGSCHDTLNYATDESATCYVHDSTEYTNLNEA